MQTDSQTLASELERAGLNTAAFGRRLHYFEETSSTSDRAAELAGAGAPEGTIVVAGRQSAGRGRQGRDWESPAGGLWMTLLLRPLLRSEELPGLTLVLAGAVCEAVVDALGPQAAVGIRWPNDVYVGDRKLAGLLAEARWSGETMEALWVGLGLNVNMSASDFSEEVRPLATSLQLESGHEVALAPLLKTLLERLEAAYHALTRDGMTAALARVRPRLVTLGRRVRAKLATELEVEGEAVALGPQGSLQLSTDEGPVDIWSCERVWLL
jgi:BirA family biotin operon repressor/biotin-[acetyl-CoA-carboxylase] ligase